MRTTSKALVVIGAMLSLAAGNASAVLINFDDVPNATVINANYAGLGVTFACSDGLYPGTCNVDGDGTNVYARATSINNSAPNVISSLGAGVPAERVNLTGVIQANFTTAVSSVSIDAFLLLSPEGFGAPGTAFLSAFNGGTFLGSMSTTANETWQTLALSFPTITHVRFSSTVASYPSYGLFDNLVFGSGNGNGNGNGTVPEPGTLALIALAMLGLSAARVRRR